MLKTENFHNKFDQNDIFSQLQSSIKLDLDSIDSESMINKYVQLKNSIQEEITRKFEGSKYVLKITEIFEKNFDLLTDYFIRCQKHTNTTKSSVFTKLVNGINMIKENYENDSFKNNTTTNYLDTKNLKFINDEEFIFMINALSSNIKDYFKNSKRGLSHIKSSSDTSIDQLLNCKSNISDLFLQLNNSCINPINPRYSQKPNNIANVKEKSLKEKLSSILDKMDNFNELSGSINNDVKFLELNSNKFYDEAKLIFKKLKQIHNDYSKAIDLENLKLDDEVMITNSNYNSNNNMSNQIRSRYNSTSPNKYLTNTSNLYLNNNTFTSEQNYRSKSKGCDEEKNLFQHKIETLKKQNQELITKMSNIQFQLETAKMDNAKIREIFKKSGSCNNKLLRDDDNSRSPSIEQNESKNMLRSKLNKSAAFSRSQDHNAKKEKVHVNVNKNSQSPTKQSIIRKNPSIPDKKQVGRNSQNLSNSVNFKTSTSPMKINNYVSNNTTTPLMVKNEVIGSNILFRLAEMVDSFVRQMSTLQEAISNKVANIKELKQKFEMNKRNLFEFASEILIKNKLKSTTNKTRQTIPKPLSISMTNDPNLFKNTSNIKCETPTDSLYFETSININNNLVNSSGKDNSQSCLKDEIVMTEGSYSNELKDSKEINNKLMRSNINAFQSDLQQINEQFDKERRTLKKDIERLTDKVNILANENNNYKAKVQLIKDLESRNKKLEDDNKNLIKDCRNLESQNKAINEKLININGDKGDLNTKYKNLKQQDENNLKEIKKLIAKVTDLNNENKGLMLQLEELRKIDKEKQDNIDNLNKNLNLKEKESKTFKDTFLMLKKENESLIKENKDFAIALESIEKSIGQEENRLANDQRNTIEVLKEKESNYISEIKGLKSQNELMKKELEVLKKEVESYKSKLESRISENNGLKDEIKTLKPLLKQNKEYDSQINNYTTQIESLEGIIKRYSDDIEKQKRANNDLKSINNDKTEKISDFNEKLKDSEKTIKELKSIINGKEDSFNDIFNSNKTFKEKEKNLEESVQILQGEVIDKDKQIKEIANINQNLKEKIANLENIQCEVNNKEANNANIILKEKIKSLEDLITNLHSHIIEKDNIIKEVSFVNKSLKEESNNLDQSHKILSLQLNEKEKLEKAYKVLSEKNQINEDSLNAFGTQLREKELVIKDLTKVNSIIKQKVIDLELNIQNHLSSLKEKENQLIELTNKNNSMTEKNNLLDTVNKTIQSQIDEKDCSLEESLNIGLTLRNKIITLEQGQKILHLQLSEKENSINELVKSNKILKETLNSYEESIRNVDIENELIKTRDSEMLNENKIKIMSLDNKIVILTNELTENSITITSLTKELENQNNKVLNLNDEKKIFISSIEELKEKLNLCKKNLEEETKAKDMLINESDIYKKREQRDEITIIKKQNEILEFNKKAINNENQIKTLSNFLENTKEELKIMKERNNSLDLLCKNNDIVKANLNNKINNLVNELKLTNQEQKMSGDEIKKKYIDEQQKNFELENAKKQLMSREIEVLNDHDKLKNVNSHLIEIVTLYNNSNITFSNLLFSDEKNDELLEIFNNITQSFSILGDKSVQNELKSLINEGYLEFYNKVERSIDTMIALESFKENSESSIATLEKTIEQILTCLKNNEKVYQERFKLNPLQSIKDKSSIKGSLITEIINYQHSSLSNYIEVLSNQIKESSFKNNDNINELNSLKNENSDLNNQIELLNEDMAIYKENSQNFLKKLYDVSKYLVTVINKLGIVPEKFIEIKNDEIVLFEVIKNYLPLIINEIANLRQKDEIDDENVCKILSLTFKSASYTLFMKENEFIWKDSNLLVLNSNSSGIKKHEEFIEYNIDKEIEVMNELREILQTKEDECLELTKHIENLQNSDKNQYEEELERITNEFNDKLEKMDNEKQLYLEEKIKEMNDILSNNQTEFEEEKENILKLEQEKHQKLFSKQEEILKSGFELEKSNFEKMILSKFEAEKLKIQESFNEEIDKINNENLKIMTDMENSYRTIIKSKDEEFKTLNINFKTDFSTLKNQIASKENELQEMRSKYNNLVNSKSKDSSDLVRTQTKEIESLTKKLKDCIEITIPNLQIDAKAKKELCEVLDADIKKSEKEKILLKGQLLECSNKNLLVEKELLKYRENKESVEKHVKEINDKLIECTNKNMELVKELKAVKNRISDLKNESEMIIEEKDTELNILREEKEIFLSEKEKVEKIVKTILFTISVFDDNKNFSKLKKNFSENDLTSNKDKKSINSNDLNEDDAYSIYKDLEEITRIIDNLHKRLNDLQRFEIEKQEEKRIVENKLEDLNKNADLKLKEYAEEIKKLKIANEEYSKKIIDAIQTKAPHLLVQNSLNSSNLKQSGEIIKMIDLFKNYNEELSKINQELEAKMLKAIAKARKYKDLYSKIMTSNSDTNPSNPCFYDPKKYIITLEKTYNNLRWFLLVYKKDDSKNLNSSDAVWVLSTNLKEDMYQKINDQSIDNIVQIENMKEIQDDLLEKLTRKEDEIVALRKERDTVLRINTGPGSSKNSTVPMEKYEFILNQLNNETNNYKSLFATCESFKKENELLRQEIDNINNKSKLSRKNVSAIEKEFLSKFIDNEEDINNMFEKDEFNNSPNNVMNNNYLMNKSKLEETTKPTEKNRSVFSEKQNVHNFSMNAVVPSKESNNQQNERRMSQSSLSKGVIPTQGNDSMKDNILKMEEEQKLFAEQLQKIKEELKETRKQKDNFKKLYEQSLTFKDDKKIEVINLLKTAVSKLVQEITLSPKIKELLIVILKGIDYSDEQINELIRKKENEKKGIFGGLFGK